jgi:hypothetical protein
MKSTFFYRAIKQTIKGTILASFVVTGASAQDTPDLSGLWFPSFGAGRGQETNGTPFNSFAQGLYDEYVAEFNVDDDPGGFCVKPGLVRSIWGAPFPVEIIQTESFINMFWEGYFQYRKIYLEGYDRPEPILNSRMGYSVGHWEGDVLVVETSYLREYPYMRRTPNTEDARVIERISVASEVNDAGETVRYLTNDMTLTDPRLYTEPVKITGSLAFSPDTPIMEYSCSEGIYDQHLLDKGLQLPDLNQ